MPVPGLADTAVWAVILAIALGTYSFRASFIILFGYLEEVPDWLTQYLQYVPAAAIAALVAPVLLAPDGVVTVSLANDQLLAGGVAAVVAYRTESMLATIVVGMVALYGVQALPF